MVIECKNRLGQTKHIREGVSSVDRVSSGTYNITYSDEAKKDEKISNIKTIVTSSETNK